MGVSGIQEQSPGRGSEGNFVPEAKAFLRIRAQILLQRHS